MNISKLVTEYPMVKGTLEWEIRNLVEHFRECRTCWDSDKCWYSENRPGHIQTLTSANTKLAAGGGNQSEWHLDASIIKRRMRISLFFDGLFQSDGSKIDEPFSFRLSTTVETTFNGKTETRSPSKGGGWSDVEGPVLITSISTTELRRIWPDGSLKISVEISHMSDLVNQATSNGQILDSTDLKHSSPIKKSMPMPSCYGNLMNNSYLSDFTIICDGSTFHAHKLILSVRSPVFRTMLESGMSESTENKMEIEDLSIETLKLMLEYIYKGTVETFPEDLKDKIGLLDCAEKYELKGLKSICMSKLFSNPPSEKDVGALAMAASVYGANAGAEKAVKDFSMKNHLKLMENPEYKKLFLANPQVFVN